MINFHTLLTFALHICTFLSLKCAYYTKSMIFVWRSDMPGYTITMNHNYFYSCFHSTNTVFIWSYFNSIRTCRLIIAFCIVCCTPDPKYSLNQYSFNWQLTSCNCRQTNVQLKLNEVKAKLQAKMCLSCSVNISPPKIIQSIPKPHISRVIIVKCEYTPNDSASCNR
jgi:hypothetical protein